MKSLAVLIVLGVALLLGGCQQQQSQSPTGPASGPSGGQATSQAPKEVPKLVFGLNADIRNFDGITTMDATTDRVLRQFYQHLCTFDKDGKIVPQLAESWRLVDDLNWEFKLRKGVKYSNGEAFNAEAAKAVLEFVANKDNNSPRRARIEAVKSVSVVDEYTIRITTSRPFPTLLEGLAQIYLVPASSLKGDGLKALAEKPIGTGPYKLQEWKREQSITVVRNDDYWGPKPQISTVEFRIIPDVSARVSALLAGEVHVIPDVPPQAIQQVNGSANAEVKKTSSIRTIFLAFNTRVPGPVQDVRFRQAVSHALDVDKIIRTVLESNAERMVGPLPVINRHLDPGLKPYPVDLARAKALLQESGYKGEEIKLHTSSGRYLKDKEAAEAIADQLKQVGINVKVQVQEWGTMLDLMRSGKADGMYLSGRSDVYLEGEILKDWFRTGLTWVNFGDPKIDAVIDEVMPTMDPEKRKQAMYKLQAQIQQHAPWAFLWTQLDLYGVNKKLQWEPRFDEQLWFHEATWK